MEKVDLTDAPDLVVLQVHLTWNLYDARHAVFQPAKMTPAQLEEGYWGAYDQFYAAPSTP